MCTRGLAFYATRLPIHCLKIKHHFLSLNLTEKKNNTKCVGTGTREQEAVEADQGAPRQKTRNEAISNAANNVDIRTQGVYRVTIVGWTV